MAAWRLERVKGVWKGRAAVAEERVVEESSWSSVDLLTPTTPSPVLSPLSVGPAVKECGGRGWRAPREARAAGCSGWWPCLAWGFFLCALTGLALLILLLPGWSSDAKAPGDHYHVHPTELRSDVYLLQMGPERTLEVSPPPGSAAQLPQSFIFVVEERGVEGTVVIRGPVLPLMGEGGAEGLGEEGLGPRLYRVGQGPCYLRNGTSTAAAVLRVVTPALGELLGSLAPLLPPAQPPCRPNDTFWLADLSTSQPIFLPKSQSDADGQASPLVAFHIASQLTPYSQPSQAPANTSAPAPLA